MKKVAGFALLTAVLLLFASGCVTMTPADKELWREIERLGLPMHTERYKSPTRAGLLNIIPGLGNLYLASGVESPDYPYFYYHQISAAALNFLPGSLLAGAGLDMGVGTYSLLFLIGPGCLWAISEAIIDAMTINKINTVQYYRYDPEGKAILEKARALERPPPREEGRHPPQKE